MANETTTQLKPIAGVKPPEVVTLYAPDGTAQPVAPVDAREILAANLGYTTEPPSAPPPVVTDDLPAHFPGLLSLKEAGITKLSELDGQTEEELTKIKGIGVPTAKQIIAKLKALQFTES